MGNCQAMEAAATVIQHPGGRVEKLYWPTTAEEVMRSHPGHHVTLCVAEKRHEAAGTGDTVRITRVKLLKPKDMLMLGQAYRLVTSQEVNKALRARKNDKMKRAQSEMIKQQQQQLQTAIDDRGAKRLQEAGKIDAEKIQLKGSKQDGERQRSETPTARARQWRPSLQSISEAVS